MPTLVPNSATAVSWGAILAGAAAAAALSFILMLLGLGFGLLSVSPWSGEGSSAEAIGFGAIIWLIIIHLAASGLGGYLAGRLRTRWTDVHHDEVYFRDTAHGLVTWSVSTLFAIALVGGAASAVMSGAAGVADRAASATESIVQESDYFANVLLRSEDWDQRADDAARSEVSAIVMRSLREGEISAEDRTYLGNLIASRTNLTANQATERVDEVYTRAQQSMERVVEAADDARSAAAWTALWMTVALLAGAFIASLLATYGGRQRDDVSTDRI